MEDDLRNFKIVIQYEGTRYQGWQRQGTTQNTLQHTVLCLHPCLLCLEQGIGQGPHQHKRQQRQHYSLQKQPDIDTAFHLLCHLPCLTGTVLIPLIRPTDSGGTEHSKGSQQDQKKAEKRGCPSGNSDSCQHRKFSCKNHCRIGPVTDPGR